MKIYTSSGVITKTVNQKQNAGKWNFLGTYNFSGQAKVVIESKASSATTCADAVMFSPASSSSGSGTTGSSAGTIASTTAIIIDNGGSGTSSSGAWRTSGASGPYGSNSLISNSVGATYTFQASRSGNQDVYIWYTYWADRYTNVPVKIYTSSGVITKTVNQKQNAGKWNFLGTYNFSGQAKVVIESKASSATTCADAVMFSPAGSSSGTSSTGSTSTSTPSGTSGSSNTIIIDNGGSGTSSSGTWKTSAGSGPYGANSLISKSVGATYTFQTSRSGDQDVYIWYTYWADRYTNVPVKIYTSSGVITKTVNQKQNAGKWYFLGTYNFSGQAKVVIESKTSSASTCADAVKFVP